jgi:hypothetical protein
MQGGDEDTVTFFKLRGGLVIFIVLRHESRGFALRARGNTPGFNLMQLLFRADFVSAARATASGAAGHFYFSGGPVDVGVVFLQPRVAHDYLLTAQASHGKEGSFRVIPVPQD